MGRTARLPRFAAPGRADMAAVDAALRRPDIAFRRSARHSPLRRRAATGADRPRPRAGVLLWIIGIMGFGMRVLDVPIAPAVVGLIFGPLAEQHFRRALEISQGDPTVFFTHPISLALLIIPALLDRSHHHEGARPGEGRARLNEPGAAESPPTSSGSAASKGRGRLCQGRTSRSGSGFRRLSEEDLGVIGSLRQVGWS